MAKDSFPLIAYRNDALGKGNIQELIVYENDARYSFFMKVVDYPVEKGKPFNKRWIWTPDSKRQEERLLTKSGDYCIIGNVLIEEKHLS